MNIENSLAARFPELAAEWHPTRNGDLTPEQVTPGSDKKVWWKCKQKGHEWQARINSRIYGNGCPCCVGHRVILGETDLATIDPELAEEWHSTRNGDLTPEQVTSQSKKKVWWKCENGHEWQARVADRTRSKKGCPYCSSLAIRYPELAAEWHPTRNGDLTPEQVTPGSGKKVWWKCEDGHEWQDMIKSRVEGKDCPYCSRLAIKHPELAAEWHPIINYNFTPDKAKCGSHKKVWWKCEKGHVWSARIYTRVKGAGCPVCWAESHTSFPEQAILYYMRKATIAESRNKEFGKEIDVYLPELRIGIEYNGFWHKDKEQADAKKVEYLAEQNIRIITIKESEENRIIGDTIEYVYSSSNKDSLKWAITVLFEILNLQPPVIDVEVDTTRIYNQYVYFEKENNLAVKYPQIAAEWHPTKNGHLKPLHVFPMSNKKVWWKCEDGHEWQAQISNRAAGRACPYCAGRKMLPGINDLASKNPKLAAEWHPTKNGYLTPEQVTPGSGKKVWWKCEDGHEWQAQIVNRYHGTGCPICARKKAQRRSAEPAAP